MSAVLGKYHILFAVAAPILCLASWATSLNLVGSSGRQIHLKLRGVDPRDLLAGHYWTYRLDLGQQDRCSSVSAKDQPICVCFSNTTDPAQLSEVTGTYPCQEAKSSCEIYLRGVCGSGGFDAGLDRFYIDEKVAAKIPTLPPNATLRVDVGSNGRGVANELLIGGQTIQQYLQSL